ncbi:DNA cytosine methyltransferase [Cytobacillus sp. FJAT-54145]|uniref:DNA (cytosine-5-)-methyltransferase n=1 Tax=Cytobacillus spartinae TaxID=3299023 RepID=A0ABW6KM97_9BACI
MKNLIKNLIKKRKAKNSKRGIYLQDRELLDTTFQAGTNYKYVIDAKNRKVIILPTDNQKDNTVSKRKLKDGIKPVIDIRSKEALSLFQGVSFLQVEIYGDEIVIEGFSEEGLNNQRSEKQIQKSLKQVTDIRQILKVKNKFCVSLSKKDLQKAVGDESYQQLSITDFLEYETSASSNVTYIQQALKDIRIPLQVVSLFSGAGLFDQAFKEKGFEIIFALEKDEEIAKTYEYNLGDITKADIRDFDKSKLPYAPIVIGGSPCKGFSNANRKSNYLDNPNNQLVKEFIKCVKQINPYVFVLENVPQILTAGNGQFFEEIQQELNTFSITKGVVSSAGFGDAQDRKRAFIIGSRLESPIELPKPFLKPFEYKTVREAFKGLNPFIPNQNDISTPKPITLERIKHVKSGGNVFDIPEDIRPKGQHSDMYKRLEWDKPAVTIVNPRKAMLLHPEENRIISLREACRLFSLPDTFIFKGALSAMQESIANAVPIQLGKAIAQKVKDAIEQFNIRERYV